ncbi:glycosyltransferase [Sphingomonas sp. RT2P30]|uniref:glycosyltransferase n=1 Tax=Parasphingomonas halimpatiens TaxID=3096162 RepID=UPI002FC694F2
MRIVDVCAFYTPHGGGVRTYVERKLRAAPALGHEMIILAPGETDSVTEIGRGGRLVTIAAPTFPLDRKYRWFDDERRLHAALDALQPDLVEASSPWSSAAMVGRWQGWAPRALVMHADPLAAYAYRWFGRVASIATIDRGFDRFWRHLRSLDQQFDLVVSASGGLSDRLLAGGVSKVITEPMGVEPGIFSPAHRSAELRREMLARCGLGEDATLLLGVGRFAAEKRWQMVVRAAAAAGRDRPIGLMLIGNGSDRARARLEKIAAGSGHVAIGGPLSDRGELAAVLASGDALVHGCEAETFCMVASEARASGLPLIVPDRGGAHDQRLAGAGLSYASGDERALTNAVRIFADRGVALQRQRAIAAAGVRTMDQHFAALFARYAALVPADRLRIAA